MDTGWGTNGANVQGLVNKSTPDVSERLDKRCFHVTTTPIKRMRSDKKKRFLIYDSYGSISGNDYAQNLCPSFASASPTQMPRKSFANKQWTRTDNKCQRTTNDLCAVLNIDIWGTGVRSNKLTVKGSPLAYFQYPSGPVRARLWTTYVEDLIFCYIT